MLTRLVVRNFKTLEDVGIELGQNVVFIGPNNSGKTSALQALALWQTGVRECARRPAAFPMTFGSPLASWATINRRDLTHMPVRDAHLLWRNKHVAAAHQQDREGFLEPVPLQVIVEGQTDGGQWHFGVEFFFANPKSLGCMPMRSVSGKLPDFPDGAKAAKIAFLPLMSGLVAEEEELLPGRVDVLVGEGQTARVLRNLCLVVLERSLRDWELITGRMRQMFSVELGLPQRDPARGTIELSFRDNDLELDIASAARGLQQTLLLLAHMHANPGATLLLDEPDAHLEVLCQRQIYNLLTETARSTGSQFIAASHSEIILDEAADRDLVIAFVGKPHRINNQGAQLRKSLTEIGFDQYAQALLRPAVYFGLRESKPDLRAFALFDRRDFGLPADFAIPAHCWRKREIENYVSRPSVLLGFAAGEQARDLVAQAETSRRWDAMEAALAQVQAAQETLGRDAWGDDIKASEEVLPNVFRLFYKSLGLRNEMNKADFHELVAYLAPEDIDPEVIAVLDKIDAALREAP